MEKFDLLKHYQEVVDKQLKYIKVLEQQVREYGLEPGKVLITLHGKISAETLAVALNKSAGRVGEAAKAIGISTRTMHRYMVKFKVDARQYRYLKPSRQPVEIIENTFCSI